MPKTVSRQKMCEGLGLKFSSFEEFKDYINGTTYRWAMIMDDENPNKVCYAGLTSCIIASRFLQSSQFGTDMVAHLLFAATDPKQEVEGNGVVRIAVSKVTPLFSKALGVDAEEVMIAELLPELPEPVITLLMMAGVSWKDIPPIDDNELVPRAIMINGKLTAIAQPGEVRE